MYTVFVCETVSGKMLAPLDCNIDSWGRVLNGTDTATVTLHPGALTLKNRDWMRLITTPVRMSLVVDWDGFPAFAGPIWTRAWDGKSLKINAAGIKSIFARRKALNWTIPYQQQTLAYANMSLGSIAAALGQVGTSGSKPGASLPIVWPTPEVDSDATHVRNYSAFNLKNISDLWADLTGVINGPDIDLLPRWTDTTRSNLQYLFRTGTNAQPSLGGSDAIMFDAAQPESSVQLLTYAEDASKLSTTQWGLGSGSDVDTLMSVSSSSALTSNAWPLLEQEKDYKSELIQATLDTSTAGDLALASTPTVQWKLTVNIAAPPVLGSYSIGTPARVRVANHLWLPDDDYHMRIIGQSGDSSSSLKLSVQEA